MGKKAVLLLILVSFIVLFAVSSASRDSGNEGKIKVIVYYRDAPAPEVKPFAAQGIQRASVSTAANAAQLVAVSGGRIDVKRSFSALNGFTAEVSPEDYESLKSNPNFEVYRDRLVSAFLSDAVNLINASKTRQLIHNGTNITGNAETVCVIDTGIDTDHPSLSGKIVGQGCFCSVINLGNSRCCPNGQATDSSAEDDHGHGTFVSGIIASQHATYAGVAPSAGVIAVKVLNSSGVGSDSDVISAIDWCISNATIYNISVISLSLGGGAYSSWCDGDPDAGSYSRPVDNATLRNITVVAATGNSGSTTQISAPACIRNVTAVGGTTKSDGFYSNGNRNNITDLIAPGVSITSLWKEGTTATADGTSASAPFVSGAIVLIREYLRVSKNETTPNMSLLLGALNSTGKLLTDTGGSGLTFARINPYAAIRAFDSAAPNVTFVAPTLADNSSHKNNASIFINVSSTETLFNAFLEWSNGSVKNYSMSGSGTRWNINFSTPVLVNSTYSVFGNDSAGNFGVTGVRHLGFVNNTMPNITSFYPSGIIINIAEPANQTFNVSYTDADGDSINVTWMQNGTIVSHNTVNFTFVSGYSSANWSRNMTYNMTVNVTDVNSTAFLNWTLNVNDTNRAPQWNATPINYTVAEDTNLSFNISGFDYDDAVSYFINNTANFTLNQTSANVSLIVIENFYGVIWLNVSVSDGFVNATEMIFVNVTPVNDTPVLTGLSNVTVNVTDWVNLSLSAADADNDLLNFSVNLTRFNSTFLNRTAANFSWKTNMSDAGVHQLKVNVTDGNRSDAKFLNVTVLARPDFDGDGLPDIYDNDDDNDGVADAEDSILGNSTTLVVNASVLSSMSLTLDGSANTSRNLTGTVFVNVSNGSRMLAQFFWNFTASNFSVNFTIITENSSAGRGEIVISNLTLTSNLTKNVTVSNISNASSVCVHDGEVSSVSNVSSACNGGSETLVLCPGASGAYTCSSAADGALYLVTGLSFSAVVEQCRDADGDGYGTGCALGSDCNDNDASKTTSCPSSSSSSSSGGGGSGGGGGGGAVKKRVLNASNASVPVPITPIDKQPVKEKNTTANLSAQPKQLNASKEQPAEAVKGKGFPWRVFAFSAAALLVFAVASKLLFRKKRRSSR